MSAGTPARTAVPPAETMPRASASSSSGPDSRVSRPTSTRARPDHSVIARPSRSTSSGVSASRPRRHALRPCRSTAARTHLGLSERNEPSCSLYPASCDDPSRAGVYPGSALAELRSLAGLVQAGLLALDDARVARESPWRFSGTRSSGSASTSARATPCRTAPAWPEIHRRGRGSAGRTCPRRRPPRGARAPCCGARRGSTPRCCGR